MRFGFYFDRKYSDGGIKEKIDYFLGEIVFSKMFVRDSHTVRFIPLYRHCYYVEKDIFY